MCRGFWSRYGVEGFNGSGPGRLAYAAVAGGTVLGYLVNAVLGGGSGSSMLVYAKLVWLLYLPVALTAALGILAFSPGRLPPREEEADRGLPGSLPGDNEGV